MRPADSSGEGQRALDRGAVLRVELVEDGALLGVVHLLDDRDGIVGFQLSRQLGDARGRQRLDDVVADIVVDLGQHLGADQIADRERQRRALVVRHDLEQIGDVRIVQLLDQRIGLVARAGFERIQHAGDEAGRQQIVVVMRFHAAVEIVFEGCFSDVGHKAPPLRSGAMVARLA